MHKRTTDNPDGKQKKHGMTAYLERLKKMALYDAKSYFDITTDEMGKQKILLKSGEEIDWDILESVEVADGKVKLKFPDRSRAMERYGKIVMAAEADTDEVSAVFLEDDDGENL